MEREERILKSAERLFHERSFDGVGVDAIAKDAGIVGSGVYRYFRSKDEILATLIARAADTLLSLAGAASADPRRDLRHLVSVHVDFALTHAALADIWQREHHNLQSNASSDLRRRESQYADLWVNCLDRCYPGNPRASLVASVRAVHALASSDTTRRSASRQAPGLRDLLIGLALAAFETLDPQHASVESVDATPAGVD